MSGARYTVGFIMGKAPRSPLLGYNHNISHLGRVFHVQTEDSGPATPRLFTHMFHEGTILASVKHEYDVTTPDDQVRVLMQNQHKTMIRDLMRAKFDDKLVLFFRARGEEILATAGALPSTPMAETPPPLLAEATALGPVGELAAGAPAVAPPLEVVPRVAPPSEEAGGALAARDGGREGAPAEPARAAGAREESEAAVEADSPVPLPIEGQRETRPLVSPSPRAGGGRAAETRRSPFVRNVGTSGGVPKNTTTATVTAKVASTDGVVMQRTVRVGSTTSVRAPRVRAPGPFTRVSPEESGGSRGQRRADVTLKHQIGGGAGAPSPETAAALAERGTASDDAAEVAPATAGTKADSSDDGLA
jgi:hypothetical protein